MSSDAQDAGRDGDRGGDSGKHMRIVQGTKIEALGDHLCSFPRGGWLGDCTGGPLIFRAFSTLVHVTDVGVLRLGVRVGLEWRAADTSHGAGAGLALLPSADALCGARTNEEPLTPGCWCLLLGGNQPMTQSEVSAAGTGGRLGIFPARQSTVNESDGGEHRSALSGTRAAAPWHPAPRREQALHASGVPLRPLPLQHGPWCPQLLQVLVVSGGPGARKQH